MFSISCRKKSQRASAPVTIVAGFAPVNRSTFACENLLHVIDIYHDEEDECCGNGNKRFTFAMRRYLVLRTINNIVYLWSASYVHPLEPSRKSREFVHVWSCADFRPFLHLPGFSTVQSTPVKLGSEQPCRRFGLLRQEFLFLQSNLLRNRLDRT